MEILRAGEGGRGCFSHGDEASVSGGRGSLCLGVRSRSCSRQTPWRIAQEGGSRNQNSRGRRQPPGGLSSYFAQFLRSSWTTGEPALYAASSASAVPIDSSPIVSSAPWPGGGMQ